MDVNISAHETVTRQFVRNSLNQHLFKALDIKAYLLSCTVYNYFLITLIFALSFLNIHIVPHNTYIVLVADWFCCHLFIPMTWKEAWNVMIVQVWLKNRWMKLFKATIFWKKYLLSMHRRSLKYKQHFFLFQLNQFRDFVWERIWNLMITFLIWPITLSELYTLSSGVL